MRWIGEARAKWNTVPAWWRAKSTMFRRLPRWSPGAHEGIRSLDTEDLLQR
jgi:hypothetical protein